MTCFLISAQLAAQTTTTETATNGVLLDNAAKSQEYQKQSGNTPSKNIFLQGSNAEAKASAKANLTDQEKQLVDNYVDHAGINKVIKEKCVGEMKQGCAGDEVDHKVMGMSPSMIRIATQAYATVGAMGDILPVSKGDGKSVFSGKSNSSTQSGGSTTPPANNGAAAQPAANGGADAAGGKATDAKKEKAEDLCKYIPAGTETIAKFAQSDAVKKIDSQVNNGGETSQKEMLLKAAKSHESRADQAQIQAVGWYGGAACYAYQASSGAFAVDTNLVVKLGAAALLGTFYQMEVSANKGYAKKVKDIANSLPGIGHCNPVTENECYCSQEEHKNDTRYCASQIQARQAAAAQFTRVTCVDNKMQADPSCACDKTNTCFDKLFENKGAADLQIGLGYTNSPFKAVTSLAHGKLENSVLSGAGYAQTSAIAKKALAELASKVPSGNGPLTASQKEVYDALLSRGIPSNAARIMAQNPPPASAMEAAKAKVAGLGGGPMIASYSPEKGSNVLDFSGGNGLGVGGGKKGDKKNGMEEFLGKMNPGAKNAANSGKILEFAQKAERQAAQVSKADKPIFEIISLRYQTSGRRLLEIDQPAPPATAAGN